MGPWICFNPYAPQGQQGGSAAGSPGGWRAPGAGLLGSTPQHQAHTAFAPVQTTQQAPSWDQVGLVAALNQLALQNQGWVMDSDASAHMSSTDGILLSCSPSSHTSITVGNGHTLPIACRGSSILPTSTSHFHL